MTEIVRLNAIFCHFLAEIQWCVCLERMPSTAVPPSKTIGLRAPEKALAAPRII
jgi:hypothetical protein